MAGTAFTREDPVGAVALEVQLPRLWWIWLVTGIAWIVAALVILLRPSARRAFAGRRMRIDGVGSSVWSTAGRDGVDADRTPFYPAADREGNVRSSLRGKTALGERLNLNRALG